MPPGERSPSNWTSNSSWTSSSPSAPRRSWPWRFGPSASHSTRISVAEHDLGGNEPLTSDRPVRELHPLGFFPMATDEVAAPAADSTGESGRERAGARSLDSARVRAENRVQRFVDAAFELLSGSAPGEDFTV